jgi:hypothetical protein
VSVVTLQVLVQLTCLQPFLERPRLQLRYTVGARQVVQDLALPVAPHKFMVPEPHIAKEAFFDKWKSYPGEQQAIYTPSWWTFWPLLSMWTCQTLAERSAATGQCGCP